MESIPPDRIISLPNTSAFTHSLRALEERGGRSGGRRIEGRDLGEGDCSFG